MGLPLPKYEPIIHVTVYLTGVTYRFATDDYYDISGNYFKGTLLSDLKLTRQLSDLYYGVEDSKSITLSFSNGPSKIDPTWDQIVETNNKELRGKSVLVERYDPTDGTSFEIRGVITSYKLGSTVDITLETRDDYILETLLPQKVVTTDEFTATALNVGEPINLCFGYCRNVPLRNVQNKISAVSTATGTTANELLDAGASFLTSTAVNEYIYNITDRTLAKITVVHSDIRLTLDADIMISGEDYAIHAHDYLIGYSTIESLWVDHDLGLGVRREGVLVDTSEYDFYDGAQASPYNGYAFIRFGLEQMGFSGNFLTISADVKGLELGGSITERNFATVLKNVLSNATWGLNDSVDAASFAAAAIALNELGYAITGVDVGNEQFQIAGDHTAFFIAGRRFRVVESTGNDEDWVVSTSAHAAGTTTITVTGDVADATVDGYIDRMYCDGAVVIQRKARDIIDEILEPARARIWRNTDGEWEIDVDVTGRSSVLGFGCNDEFYNNCEVTSTSAASVKNALQTVIVHYSLDPANDENPFKELSTSVHTGFGEKKTYELPFVLEDDTAIKVLSYLKNRSLYSDKTATIRGGMECRDLREGNIITLTDPLRDISAREYMIQSISKGIADFEMECREYSTSIYDTEVIAPPLFFDSTGVIVRGSSVMRGVITLGDGIGPGQIILRVAAGEGDTYIAAGKNDFVTTTNGFILGIDDSDADKVKFYLGDASENLYWDGSNLYITGTITADAGVIGGWIISATALADNAVAANANIYIDSANTLIRVGPTTGKYLTIDGANLRIRSSDYVAGRGGAGFTLEPDLLEVGNIAARGIMRTAVFQKDVISCVGGNLAVLPADVLATDMTALDAADVVIEGNETFVNGDLLRIRTGSGTVGDGSDDDEWFEVINAAGAPTYVMDRDKGTDYGVDSNPTWPKGAAVVNYGQSGDGLVYMTASDTNAPYLTVMTHAGAPWAALSEKVRIGNLNGYAGYVADIYGMAIYEDANNYLLFDPTNGIRIASNTSDAITIKSGGNINLEAGGDIILTPSDADPALISWSTRNINIGCAITQANALCIWPTSVSTEVFRVGWSPVTAAFHPFYDIDIDSYHHTWIRCRYNSDNYASVRLNSTLGDSYVEFYSRVSGGTVYSLAYKDNVLAPLLTSNVIDLGSSTLKFRQGWFGDYVIVIGGIHVGGAADPGTGNLVVDGSLSVGGGFLKQYVGGVDFTVTVAGGDWTSDRDIAIPYQTTDGTWRLRFNCAGEKSGGAVNDITITISGVTFKNVANFRQAVAGTVIPVAASAVIVHGAWVYPNTGNIGTKTSAVVNDIAYSGDVELESKPTWAD